MSHTECSIYGIKITGRKRHQREKNEHTSVSCDYPCLVVRDMTYSVSLLFLIMCVCIHKCACVGVSANAQEGQSRTYEHL